MTNPRFAGEPRYAKYYADVPSFAPTANGRLTTNTAFTLLKAFSVRETPIKKGFVLIFRGVSSS